MTPVKRLAFACGCDTATINGIENETIECTEVFLTKLARELNVSIAQLTQDTPKDSAAWHSAVPESEPREESTAIQTDQAASQSQQQGDVEETDSVTADGRRDSTTKEATAALDRVAKHLANALVQCAAATAADPDDYRLRGDLANVLQVIERAELLRKDLGTIENICFRLKNHHQPVENL